MEVARESIFVSALRTFCRMFFGIIGLLIGLFLFFLLYGSLSSSVVLEEKTSMEILPDANWKREMVSVTAPVILQIPIHGVIGDPQKLDAETFQNILVESRTNLLSRDRVKGILLHFNTPGGTATDSDEIYRMLKEYKARYKVPVFAYAEGLCASGGFYIACAADQIFASPSSTIGSVGVLIGPFFNFSDLMEKMGIQARTITDGKDKDMMNPTRPWKPGEDQSIKEITTFTYNQFVNIVAESRPQLDRSKLVNEYGAQVFDCITAKQYGYIDQPMSSRTEALLALLKEADISPETPYQVVSLTPKGSWVSHLISCKSPLISGKVNHVLDFGQPPIQEQAAYLYQPSRNR